MPSSSTASASDVLPEIPAEVSIQDLHMQLAKIDILPWTVNDIEDNGTFKLEFYDGAHGID